LNLDLFWRFGRLLRHVFKLTFTPHTVKLKSALHLILYLYRIKFCLVSRQISFPPVISVIVVVASSYHPCPSSCRLC
jgi:hypothetical protein